MRKALFERKCKLKKDAQLKALKGDLEKVKKRNSELKEKRQNLKKKIERIRVACLHYAPQMFQPNCQFAHQFNPMNAI